MGCLASVAVIEKLGQSLALDGVDGVHIKPGAITGQNDSMCLRNEVFTGGVLDALLSLSILGSGISTSGSLVSALLI